MRGKWISPSGVVVETSEEHGKYLEAAFGFKKIETLETTGTKNEKPAKIHDNDNVT